MKVMVKPIEIDPFGTIPKDLVNRLEDFEIRWQVEIMQTNIILISPNTEKSPEDLRIAVNQTSVKNICQIWCKKKLSKE